MSGPSKPGGGLSTWTLMRRALRTHRVAIVLLGVVVAVGAFLGAAGPRWANDNLDAALRDVLVDAGPRAEVSLRDTLPPQPGVLNSRVPSLEADTRPELRRVLGDSRWAVTTSDGQLTIQNGRLTDDGLLPRVGVIRVPDDLASRVRVVEGALPSRVETVPAPELLQQLPVVPVETVTIVDVVATAKVADALKLVVGDVVMFEHRSANASAIQVGAGDRLTVAGRLTGIVEAVDETDPAWRDAGTALTPDPGAPGAEPRITTGTLLSDPALLAAWSGANAIVLDADWHIALQPDLVEADDVDAITADLRRLTTATAWRSGLTTILDDYSARRGAAEATVAFGVVSLAALCAALILLSARLLADRRAEETALARTRGASDAALARLLALDAAAVAVPAAALGTIAALVLIPGRSSTLSLVVPAALALAAVVALPVLTLRQARHAGLGGDDERADVVALRPDPRRLMAEAGVVVLAGVGLWLVTTRDGSAGVDPVVSLVPIVVAVAAGLLIFRVMPFLVAALLPGLRRGQALTPFIAATNAARAPAHAVLPVIALLVAIGVAAFGGTVKASVEHARTVSSWDQVAGDALVQSGTIRVSPEQLASIPGADDIALGHLINSQRPENLDNGRRAGVDILAVDVPAWQRVTADAPEPIAPVAALTSTTTSGDLPAVIQGSIDVIGVGDRLRIDLRGVEVTVEIVDQLPSVPGAGSSATVVIPLAPVAEASLGPANVVYVSGDVTADDVASTLGIEPDEVQTRTGLLTSIDADPVIGTVLEAFTMITVLAAALAGAAAVIGLAVGERARSYALSILRTLGLTTRQTATLTAADVIPTSVVAAAAGVGVGIGVGVVTAGALDLTALSGALTGDAAIVTDVPGAIRAAAIVLAVVIVAVVVAVAVNRRAQLGSVLRAGDST